MSDIFALSGTGTVFVLAVVYRCIVVLTRPILCEYRLLGNQLSVLVRIPREQPVQFLLLILSCLGLFIVLY